MFRRISSNDQKISVSHKYCCPITGEILKEPVLFIKDGYSYERAAITERIINATHGNGSIKSPVTNIEYRVYEPLETLLLPNYTLQELIQEHVAHNPKENSLSEKSAPSLTQTSNASASPMLFSYSSAGPSSAASGQSADEALPLYTEMPEQDADGEEEQQPTAFIKLPKPLELVPHPVSPTVPLSTGYLLCNTKFLVHGSDGTRRKDSVIDYWRLSDGQHFSILEAHSKIEQEKKFSHKINGLCFVSQDKLVSTGDEGKLKIWDLEAGTCQKEIELPYEFLKLTCLQYSSKQGRLLAANANRVLSIDINSSNRKPFDLLIGTTDGDIQCLELISSELLATGSNNGEVLFWNQDGSSFLLTKDRHDNAITALCALSKTQLASGSKDGSVKIWDIENKTCVNISNSEAKKTPIIYLHRLPENRLLIAASQSVTIMNLADNQSFEPFRTPEIAPRTHDYNSKLACMLLLPDGRLVGGSMDNVQNKAKPTVGSLRLLEHDSLSPSFSSARPRVF